MKCIILTNLDKNFTRSYCFREGLFAAFTGLLGILPVLEKYQLKPIIQPKIKYYSTSEFDFNMFPHYLELNYIPEPIECLSEEFRIQFEKEFRENMFIETSEYIVLDIQTLYCISSSSDCYSETPSFEEAYSLFFKYYKFPNHILNKVNSVIDHKFSKKVLGLHYRGSDKLNDASQNPNHLSKEDYIHIIEEYINREGIKNVFLATDSSTIIPYIKALSDKYELNVITTDSVRFNDHTSPFIQNSEDPFKLGFDCLVDSILLSSCEFMILTSSNVSAWSKIFNPKLRAYKINYFPYTWFPQYYIPYYTSDDSSVKNILEKVQTKHIK